ncbi:MAG: hypothetical protein KAG96_03105 [Ichthyobacteriaceae bacterium]|nr:hypothetical protein [Ichthyobacteriaceae bacterium]
MKAKIIGLVLFLVGLGANLNAQDTACKNDPVIREKLSIYTEYYKSKNYEDAYTNWKEVYEECPNATKNLYIHGPRLVTKQIKKAKSPEEKEILVGQLVKLYDDRMEYYPSAKKKGYVLGKKGVTMVNYKYGTSKEAFDVLDEAYKIDGDNLSSTSLNRYFVSSVRLFQEKEFTDEQVFEVYDNVMVSIENSLDKENDIIAKLEQKKNEGTELSKKEAKKLKIAKNHVGAYETNAASLEKTIGKIATCDRLEALYGVKFEENKDNIKWVNGGVKMMSRKKCFSSDVFFKLIDSKSKLAPDASSSRVAGLLSLSNKNFTEAIKYYDEAIALESDPKKKSKDYLNGAKALFKIGKKSKARTYAREAIKLNKNWGDPYILIGDMYASSANSCGTNGFEKKAVYWAALDKYSKARRVDPKAASTASKKISQWGTQVPNKTMIFQFGYIGKPTYKIECWIHETVKVPQS